jgi:hypothetical protein
MNDIKGCSQVRLSSERTKSMNCKDESQKVKLKESLLKLDKRQYKLFYSILVHYWIEYNSFISQRNFFNLWCELNELCHDIDEGFPEPHNDRELLKSYCIAHPYYFIDILDTVIVTDLFCEHINHKLDILTIIAQKLATEGLWAAYESSNKALGLYENVENLVLEAEEHLKSFS